MNKRKHLKLSILVITIILGITVVCSSCLSIITRGLISAFSSATDALSSDTTWTENTNITNNIAVTFKNDVMLATWDYNSNCNYTLKINDGSQDRTIDSTDETYTNGEIDLSSLGYTYEDTLTLQMYKTNSTNQTASYKYTYNGLSKYDYNKYTQKVSAGFEEIDYYIATREELFDLWSYLIIYRDGAKYDSKEGGYTLDKEIYMAYNYRSLYSDATQSDAYKFEIYSALAAFEDSCAYGYGYEMNSDGVHGEISICLYSSENPQFTTTTNQKYKNVYNPNDYYTLNRQPLFLDQYDESRTVASRTYAIDSITKTVTVKTSDQLYYAIKMGYKPNCVKNSNAELLYNRMKE
ncbi:MAG: hypothetical protein K5765_00875, partial [Clostridia bacterium]|nr:hypothetical protein [Clostridia bacterium]